MGYSVIAFERKPYKLLGDFPLSGSKYVGVEAFMDLLYANGETYDDYSSFGGGGYYVRVKPEVLDVMIPAIALLENAEIFLKTVRWMKQHPDAWIEGYH